MLTDFNRLKVFYTIYRYKSAAAAARELYISQSAVSQSLGKLERELKTQLFVRMHKKLVPTSAAGRLYEIVEPFVRGLEGGLAWLEAEKSGPRGVLRIGAPVEFGSRNLVELVAAFRRRHPAVFFEVSLGHPDILLPRLAGGELDLLFADIFPGRRGRNLPPFSVSTVLTEKLVLACSAGYYSTRLRGAVEPSALAGCEFLDYSHGRSALDNWFRHHYGRSFPGLKVVLTVESVQAILNAIKGGLGLGIVPEYLVEKELKAGPVRAVRTGRPELVNRISLVRLKGKAASPAEKEFLENF
ncbi:MAG: LysR family transcriptional regulator [Elusimicrobia bacterium CG08_land_8_20_14_0_20_59_10]|nr:MAG: LysR family transcriptional regulator [Elusimicrobia bacterium CG08_land_8_20_14_0_20_59_10]